MVAIHTTNPSMNSIKYLKTLRKAQFTQEQAEGIALGFEHLTADLATKTDIHDLLKEMEAQRLATKADIHSLQKDMEAMRLATKADIHDLQKNIEALQLVTKADIYDSELRLQKNIEELRLATKTSINDSELRLQKDIEALRKDSTHEIALIRKDIAIFTENTQTRLAELKMELAIWMFGIGATTVIAIVGLLKYTH